MNAPQPIPFVAEGPQPLVRDIPKSEAYPVEALGPLRPVVEAVADETQAPVAIAAQSALAVASLATQAHADVQTLGGPAPTSLFALTVAESGERKSGCDRHLTSVIKEIERERTQQYRLDMADYDGAAKLWDARQAKLIKEATGKGIKATEAEADLAEMSPRPEPPLSPIQIVGDPTYDGLTKHLIGSTPSVAILTDEGGAFVGGHAMNSENKLRTVAGLSSLWDGSPINRTRAGDGVTTIFGRRLAAHLLIQPIAAAPLLSDRVANAQGFLARFLIAQPQSHIGFRLRRGSDPASAGEIRRFGERISDLMETPPPLREGTRNVLWPRLLRPADDAQELLYRYAEVVEKAQAPGGAYEGVRPFASKSAEQACRIAATLALFDDLNCREISAEMMANGIALARFYLGEACRLADGAAITEETQQAEDLRVWLVERWTEPYISVQAVVRYGPNRLRESKVVKKLFSVIEDSGWIVRTDHPVDVNGAKAATAWRIVKC